MGPVGFRSAMHGTPSMPYVCTKQKGRYDDGGMDGVMGSRREATKSSESKYDS